MASSKDLHRLLFAKKIEKYRWVIGRWRAWRTYNLALKHVPAYKDFVKKQAGEVPKWHAPKTALDPIPEMDKKSYIKTHKIEDLCYGGKLPTKGVVVDESSGSSGQPTSWVRGPYERFMIKKILQVVFSESTGNKPVFVINAFALGAWATGMNVSASLTDSSIIKSTGPDIDKIITTLDQFGTNYSYVILGYPPFLKNLADDERIDLSKYDVIAGYGGEGLSENMRRYLLKSFKRVTGSYGASDLEINIAVETDFTIALRNSIENNEELRNELIRTEYGVLPMVFQYNPYDYVIESNDNGELLVTIARKENISPRIRYNIHDRGHVIRLKNLRPILEKHNLGKLDDHIRLDMPILFHYGRSDMSVDYYGANVTPDSIRQVLYDQPEIAKRMNTFNLAKVEDKNHNQNMVVNVEFREGEDNKLENNKKIAEEFFKQLSELNKDFYNAYYNTAPDGSKAQLNFFKFGTGPFEGSGKKLKNEYVKTDLKYDKL